MAAPHAARLGTASAWWSVLIAISPAMLQAQVVEPANQSSSTRTLVYERDAATGMVTAETLEPDASQHCLRREFIRDLQGNITETRERNCATSATGTALFITRVHKDSYGAAGSSSAGVYPTTSTNAAGHVQQAEFNNAWGSVTRERDANGLTTTHEQDSLGRRTRSVFPDGRVMNWRYDYCNGQAIGN